MVLTSIMLLQKCLRQAHSNDISHIQLKVKPVPQRVECELISIATKLNYLLTWVDKYFNVAYLCSTWTVCEGQSPFPQH